MRGSWSVLSQSRLCFVEPIARGLEAFVRGLFRTHAIDLAHGRDIDRLRAVQRTALGLLLETALALALGLSPALAGCGESPTADTGDADASASELTEPVDPDPCPELEACSRNDLGMPFSLVLEAPENVELQAAEENRLLGYDGAAEQWVVYSAETEWSTSLHVPTVGELRRFETTYDRVQLSSTGVVLACAKATCDLVDSYRVKKIRRVPDEVAARTSNLGCVGGQGITCFDETQGRWSWMAAPASFEAPVAFFLRLGAVELLAVDTNGATWLVRGNEVRPFDTGAGEPLVALASRSGVVGQQWLGRTASGRLVVGSLKGGRSCAVHVDAIGSAFFRQKDTLVRLGADNSCWKTELPPNMSGVAFTRCGATLAFDRHRVVSTSVMCPID